MTGSPHAQPLACRTLAEAVAALRERGLRLSTSRKMVLEALFATDSPVSSEHLAGQLGMDLSTVYRARFTHFAIVGTCPQCLHR